MKRNSNGNKDGSQEQIIVAPPRMDERTKRKIQNRNRFKVYQVNNGSMRNCTYPKPRRSCRFRHRVFFGQIQKKKKKGSLKRESPKGGEEGM